MAFARYAVAASDEKEKELAYRVYVTDALRLALENTAAVASKYGGDGKFIEVRFCDAIKPKPQEARTEEEIITHIKKGVRGDNE